MIPIFMLFAVLVLMHCMQYFVLPGWHTAGQDGPMAGEAPGANVDHRVRQLTLLSHLVQHGQDPRRLVRISKEYIRPVALFRGAACSSARIHGYCT